MIPYGEKWHYFAVIKLSALLRGITSKDYCDFYCLNCLHSFATEKNKSHKMLFENKGFCNVIKYLSLIHIKIVIFIIYADLECKIERLMDVKIILKTHLQEK